MAREKMEFDVIIVGAGPAGLAAAIRLAQLGNTQNTPLNICVLDKAAQVGDHILSGAVLDPRALNELIPDWHEKNAPVNTAVTHDQFLLLTATSAWHLPTPPQMHNQGNYIISLGKLCRWLALQAESLGVNIFPAFAATDILYHGDRVCGVITGDKGVDRQIVINLAWNFMQNKLFLLKAAVVPSPKSWARVMICMLIATHKHMVLALKNYGKFLKMCTQQVQ
jgi:electron-transferring-flavoprotein dehydrogenase